VVEEQLRALPARERSVLERLVETLPARVAAIDACGVPDALVHGDFHPGNVGGTVHHHRILDWGDSFVGNPLVDELAFTQRLPAQEARTARGWFLSAWRRITPGADPERAADLLRPVLPLLAAVVYDRFCAAIEPDERVYHRHDTVLMLRRAAAEATSRP
jgi:Ser/Thr protein kinase RdoA (MazF antagonist)